MSYAMAVLLIVALDAFVVVALACVCSIPFRFHKAPHTPPFFNVVLTGTLDVPKAFEAYESLPALD